MVRNLSILSFLVVALLVLGFVLVGQPSEAEAGQCLPCSLGSPTTTPALTVNDQVSCAWSISKAQSMLESQYASGCSDGFCVKQFITVNACSANDPLHSVTLKLKFQCLECVQFPGM